MAKKDSDAALIKQMHDSEEQLSRVRKAALEQVTLAEQRGENKAAKARLEAEEKIAQMQQVMDQFDESVQKEVENQVASMKAEYDEKERKNKEMLAKSQKKVDDLREQLDDASASWKEAEKRINMIEAERDKALEQARVAQEKADATSLSQYLFASHKAKKFSNDSNRKEDNK